VFVIRALIESKEVVVVVVVNIQFWNRLTLEIVTISRYKSIIRIKLVISPKIEAKQM
jgi:hypothetical protein